MREVMALTDGHGLLRGVLDSAADARRFWIGVASRDHLNVGVKGGFIQLNHGKQAPLRRLKAGDGVIMYSPRTTYPDGEPLKPSRPSERWSQATCTKSK